MERQSSLGDVAQLAKGLTIVPKSRGQRASISSDKKCAVLSSS